MASNSAAARRACLASDNPEVSSHTFRRCALQQLRDGRPFRVEQRFAAGQHHEPRSQLLEAGQQARNRFESHIGAAVPPVVAGDATRIAALGHI
jgi:hypothetical protein